MYYDILQELSSRYGKATITKVELASELGVSIYTINTYMSKGINIPEYLKLGKAKNSKVVFPIANVAKFLATTTKIFKP